MKKTTLRQVAFKLAFVAFVLLAPLGLRAQQTAPYNEGFESMSSVGDLNSAGWEMVYQSHSGSFLVVETSANNVFAGSKALDIDSWNAGSTSDYVIVGLPLITNKEVNELQITFSYKVSNGNVDIGYLTDADDGSTFESLASFNSSSTYSTQTVELSTAPSNAARIAIKYSNWYRCYVDAVIVEELPTCFPPQNLAASLTPGDGSVAMLTWQRHANGTENDWVVEYGTDPNFIGATSVNVTGGTPSKALTGLTPEQTYYARVKAICGDEDVSLWSSEEGISFTPTDAYSITLNDQNTTTNSYIPIYGNYVDWGNRSQFIIPATTLTNLQWGSISKITFYATQSSTTFTNDAFNFYMKEVPSTTFASTTFEDWDGLSTVYSGSVAISDNKMVITFENPYTYQGGNLLIGSQQTAYNSTVSCNWVGVSQSGNNTALYQTANSSHSWSGSVTTQQFLPKLTIEYTPGVAPSCLPPTDLAATPSTTSAELSWTANSSETAWTIYYKKTTDENYTEVANATNPYTLNDLTAATNYQYYVVANCAADEASDPSVVFPFATECDVISTFPWSENFENYTAGNFNANCWVNEHISGSGTQIFKVYTSTNGSNSTHQLQLPDMSSGTMTKLQLPLMTLPNANYQFSIDVLRNATGTSYTSEGVRVFASTTGEIEGATELGFLYRNHTQTDGGVVVAENAYGWYTYEFPIPFSGTCYIILRGENQYGSSTYMDNLIVEQIPTCRKPSGLMLETPSAKTAHTATLKWTNGEEGQTAWQIAYSTDANFDPNSVTPIDVTTNPATIVGLAQSTTYYAYVRANCGSEDGMSAWCINKAAFATLAGNNALTGLAVPDITVSSSTATASWNANAANNLHQLYELYLSTDATAPTAESTPTYATTETSYTFTGLTPETQYFVWVRDNCGTDGVSTWAGPVDFTTQASCPTPVLNADGITNITAHTADVEWSNYTENTNYEVSYRTAAYFNGETEEFGNDIPTGWARYKGLLNDGGTATLNSTTDGWYFGTANGVFDNHARLNIFSNYQRWLVTPALTVPENGALTFDMALTAFSGTLPAPQTTGTDDKFVVLITTDEMATWTVLREWNNSGSEYVYNNIPCSATGENVMINLGVYVGQTVRIAFYGESTTSNADNELHIDNVGVGVAVEAGEWQTQNVTENSHQLTNLVAETSYDVRVKGYCNATVGGESDIQTFTTTVACPVPTGLDTVGDATTNSVNLTWTAGAVNQDAWQICLNGDETNLLDVTDATVTGTTVTYTLTGLTSGADYSVKVRANCGNVDGVSLQWTNTVNFTTEASCTEPTAFAVVENSVEAHQAQLSWTAGADETAWDIYYSTTATEAPVNGVTEPTVGAITANPYTLAGLDAATTYYVWVRAHCGDAAGQQSPWVGPVTFTTACEIIPANGYSENFDSYTAGNNVLPLCWSYINTTTYSTCAAYPRVYANSYFTYANSAPNCLYLYSYGSSDPQPQYAILPEMSGLAGMRVTLQARGYNTGSTFKVGTMSDPADASTFTAIAEQTGLTTSYQEFSFDVTNSNDHYLAIMIDAAPSGYNTRGVYIDDITIAPIPSCDVPTFVVSNKDAHAGQLTITASVSGEDHWDIYFSTENINPDNETTPNVSNTPNTQPWIGGDALAAATTYYVWVRAHCSDNERSEWYGPVSFTTNCEAISIDENTPYTQNFDDPAMLSGDLNSIATSTSAPAGYYPLSHALPSCWRFLNMSNNTSTYPQVFLSSYSDYIVAGNCLFFKSSSSTPLYAILPQFENNLSNLMISFTYRNEGTGNSNGHLYVSYMTNPSDASTFDTEHQVECSQMSNLTTVSNVNFPEAPAGSYFAFKYEGGSSNNYYLSIDNVSVGVIPSCWPVATLGEATDIAPTSAKLSWTLYDDNQDAWVVEYSTDENFATYETAEATTNANYLLSPLAPSTTYYVRVKANCGNNGYSTASNVVTFSTPEACPTPTDLEAYNITNSTATVSWNGQNDSYNFKYRVAAGLGTPIFSEDFSNGIGDWTMLNCHYSTGITNNGVFSFHWNTNPPQYLISPEITGINSDAVVEFTYWNDDSDYDETFQVGMSSTTNDVDAFSWSETITAEDQIHNTYHATVPAGTRYIAIQLLSDDQLYLYIDDIVIGEPVNAGEWVETSVNENHVDLSGLTAETKYDAQVQGVCSSLSMTTEWTNTYTFTTKSVFTKAVEANKWYAISSPMHNMDNNETLEGVNNLTGSSFSYDLYGYDESMGQWRKPEYLARAKGYIYRRSEATNLEFSGDANSGNFYASDISVSCPDLDLKGFALVGNPYKHTIYKGVAFGTSSNFITGWYKLTKEGLWLVQTNDDPINAGEAALVKVSSNWSVSNNFTDNANAPTAKSAHATTLAFSVSNDKYEDKAYAMFSDGEGLTKVGHLAADAPALSIAFDGRRYAIAQIGADAEAFEMNFRGGEGSYTIAADEAELSTFSYIHLIDRATGKDIDLLSNPTYSFTQNGSESVSSRFLVRLSPESSTDASASNFVYWNGSAWVVEGNGTLQVFDVLGRKVFSKEVNTEVTIPTSQFPGAGVYIIRLGEKSQKIVVK